MFKAEHGIVKFFDDRSGKQYGFIRVLDATAKKRERRFSSISTTASSSRPSLWEKSALGGVPPMKSVANEFTIDKPRKGDKIYFFRRRGQGGKSKACPWGAGNQNYLWGINGYPPTVSEIFDGAGVPVPDEPNVLL